MITKFDLNDFEIKKLKKFWKKHYTKGMCRGYPTYTFSPTGIGIGVHIVCSCGENKDLSDYGSW